MNLSMRVVSFCHYLQGPAATQYLADMGAEVIKIEPLQGAFERHWSGGKSFIGDISAFFLSANRNKRSLAIDLKKPGARKVILRIVDQADVVVENFRPGVMARLGLDAKTLRGRRPELIYASATGLGADGPAADRPGQDLLMQARSGLTAVTGGRGAAPTVVGAAVVDQHGAALLAMGILAAFARRQQTGKGALVETSLFQAGIDLQAEALTKYFARSVAGDVLDRDPHVGSWYHDAPYGAYRLKDAHIVLSMNDPHRLADALDSDALRAVADIDRYCERERYARLVADVLAPMTRQEVVARFNRAGVWYELVQDYDDLRADPQAGHLGVFVEHEVDGKTVTLVGNPLRIDGEQPSIRTIPLRLGCDSRSVLAAHGFGDDEIDRLVEDGVIADPDQVARSIDETQRKGRMAE